MRQKGAERPSRKRRLSRNQPIKLRHQYTSRSNLTVIVSHSVSFKMAPKVKEASYLHHWRQSTYRSSSSCCRWRWGRPFHYCKIRREQSRPGLGHHNPRRGHHLGHLFYRLMRCGIPRSPTPGSNPVLVLTKYRTDSSGRFAPDGQLRKLSC